MPWRESQLAHAGHQGGDLAPVGLAQFGQLGEATLAVPPNPLRRDTTFRPD